MNKWLQVALPIMIGLSLVFGMANWLNQNGLPGPVGADVQAVGLRPLIPYLAFYEDSVTSDKFVILVDLSDSANYPHVHTNKIILKSIRVAGDLSAAVHWHYYVGVVTAVSDSGTTIEWVWGGARVRATQFDERWALPEHGLSLAVVGATLDRVATIQTLTTATITTTTEISTTVAVTGVVGVGDLILYTNEISDTATLDIVISAGYDTE